MLWKQQVLAAIRGHNLLKFLKSSKKPEKYLISQDEEADNINTDLLEWEQQDQLLVFWLLSSMSEGLLTRMVGCETSYQIWTKLNQYFATQTRAKLSQLKVMLQSAKKGS